MPISAAAAPAYGGGTETVPEIPLRRRLRSHIIDGMHADLPATPSAARGFDMPRDLGHHGAHEPAQVGNDVTHAHHPDHPRGATRMTSHARRRLPAPDQLAPMLGGALRA